MRVGRPIKALLEPVCDYCGARATLARFGDGSYPYREDHGAVWQCTACDAWIGVFARSSRHVPLGRLANAELRDAKARLHAALEPLVAAKVRRDAVNAFKARAHAFRWLANELGMDEQLCLMHLLDLEQCRAALAVVERFGQERRRSGAERAD
jgi:hypothetical protein